MIDNNQVVYRKYTKLENNKAYLYINYVLNATYTVLGIETGYFEISGSIVYQPDQHYVWYMEFDAKREGQDFVLQNVTNLIRCD